MLLVSVVRLEQMRTPDLTLTHVCHVLRRGQIASVETTRERPLPPVDNMVLCCDRGERRGLSLTTRSLSTFFVIAWSHSLALGPFNIPQRRLNQREKYRGLYLECWFMIHFQTHKRYCGTKGPMGWKFASENGSRYTAKWAEL